jgi:tRNA-specific 2-thiouridylase
MSKVCVAMSGGVDSSVSAALLQKEGHDVTGVFIKTWHPPFLTCTWREERQDAMDVCAHLGIPFQSMDLEEEYKKEVVDYMIAEYAQGRTPNPDVMCNDKIKFGAFFKKAKEMGAEYIATGHYARTLREAPSTKHQEPNVKLLAGVDANKDQSYFLWRIPQETLNHVLFPVGGYEKPKVRELAKEFGLSIALKKDSQGVCFLGNVDIKDFLKRFIDVAEGDVLDEQGKRIGTHEGAILYTLGQRHGFDITDKTPTSGPFYVVQKDVANNTITVSEHLKTTTTFDVSRAVLSDVHWISGIAPESGSYEARFRYRQPLQTCQFDTKTMTVTFSAPQKSIALGQSLVLYRGEEVVGGGVINRVS